MAYFADAPSRILKLPPSVIRPNGIAELVLLVVYVAWVWRKPRSLDLKKIAAIVLLGLVALVWRSRSLDEPLDLKIIAAMFVLGLVALVWRWPRSLRDWRVPLPGGFSTLIQIGIGVMDLGCSSLAMYSLIPAASDGGLFTVAVAFVSATMLGFASHARARSACSMPPCWSRCRTSAPRSCSRAS
jgi:hypothetical protein